jgi:ABC-2 type transport system permease protein
MKYPTQIIIIFGILGIFTTAVGLLLAAFINDENMVWNFGVLVLLPTSILSGALFPFSSMPKSLQILGNIFPQRWIIMSIEKLQKGGMLTDTLFPLSGTFALSIIMFIVASIRLNKIKA